MVFYDAAVRARTSAIRPMLNREKKRCDGGKCGGAADDENNRYASLFFVACIDQDDNELITLEKIHLFVEVLDRYFGNVCELDIIFNFHKAYYILDELFIGGELQVGLGFVRCMAGIWMWRKAEKFSTSVRDKKVPGELHAVISSF